MRSSLISTEPSGSDTTSLSSSQALSIAIGIAKIRHDVSSSILTNVPGEVRLSDYYFNLAWPGGMNVNASTDGFKPSILTWLVYRYKIRSLFDSNVGRGNRMISCLLERVNYVGVYDYLPMKKVVPEVLSSLKADPRECTLLYGSFDTVSIGDYQVNAIFVTFYKGQSDVQICNWIIKAWNNLDPDSILIMYSEMFDQRFRNLTSQVMEILVGVMRTSDKIFDVGTEGAGLRVWRKTDQMVDKPFEHITLSKNLYRSGNTTLLRRALPSYLRLYERGTRLHYLCNSFIPDLIALDLAATIPVGELTLHVNNSSRWNSFAGKLSKFGHKIVLYSTDSNIRRKELSDSLDARDVLLPAMMDTPLFEACLIQALRVYLPQDSGKLTSVERVWIETEYSVLIRSLLYVWPETTLLVSTVTSVDKVARRAIPIEQLGRVIFHKSDKSGLEGMRTKLGYSDDAIMKEG